MYNLLIVDDEKITADFMQKFFEDDSGMDLHVNKSYSAIDAIDIMSIEKVDIVVSDIRMPEMNGLEFLDRIRIQWPDCLVIFLTGHNEFKYIQAAMRKDSTDFVLKSEGEEAVLEAVKKAVRELDSRKNDRQFIEKTKEQVKAVMPILQEKYLIEIVEGLICKEEERIRQFYELNIQLDAKSPVYMLLGRIDTFPEHITFTKKQRLFYEIKDLVAEETKKMAISISVTYERDNLVWFFQPFISGKNDKKAKYMWSRMISFIQGSLSSIQSRVNNITGAKISFSSLDYKVMWENTHKNLVSLMMLLDKTAGVDTEVIVTEKSDVIFQGEEGELLEENYLMQRNIESINLLDAYLKSGQKDQFRTQLKKITSSISNIPKQSYNSIKEGYYRIAIILFSYINRNNLEVELVNKYKIFVDDILKIENHASWNEAVEYFKKLTEYIFELKIEKFSQSSSQLIDRVKEYIINNLDKDISLTRLADIFSVNSSYLSRIFKQNAGQGVMEFISEVRLNKAVELLKNMDKKISDISQELGFSNPSYFGWFFKKHTNMSPKEYREVYRS